MILKIKIIDVFILLIAVGLIGFSAYAAYVKPFGFSQILIKGQDSEWTFPADAEEIITVPGPLGNTVIRMHAGRVWVESSPCKNQTCVETGFLSKQGQWSACLPNGVLLIVFGTENEDVDAAAW